MDARKRNTVFTATAVRAILAATLLATTMGASRRSANFIVDTDDPAFAEQVARTAETVRRDLAIAWLGQAMPNWSQPCVMTVLAAPHLGAGGQTTFKFQDGEVFDWRMSIQGSRERILDSVLPHEITHMIFASHFRQPLPRWADEGGATSVEHPIERTKHRQMLPMFLRTGRGIAFNNMFAMMDYPSDFMPLYAQGYSVAEFLIQADGRRAYVEFLDDGMKAGDWSAAVARHYGAKDLGVLQNTWLEWVKRGAPLSRPGQSLPTEMLAAVGRPARPEPNLVYHIRDKQPAGATTVGTPTPPAQSLTSMAGAAAGDAQVLPASGWQAAGQREPVVMAGGDSAPTQVSRPQHFEQPAQTILR
jgi:hypothetical protein